MKKNKFKKGDIVRDKDYPFWSYGIVKKVLKTRIKVLFISSFCVHTDKDGFVTYDKEHYQFLEKEEGHHAL